MEKDGQRVSAQLVCILVLELLGFAHVIRGQVDGPLTPAMFIFGDSLIDDGNNNYIPTIARANYFPYGIDLGFPTGRFCNGLTVVDYGARLLGLPFIPPYLSPTSKGTNILRGLNYASAAAGIIDETGRHYGARTPFNGQILLFEKTVRLELPNLFQSQEDLSLYLAKSVFLVNIGSNDYINNYLLPRMYASSHVYDGQAFADLLIGILSQQLQRELSRGNPESGFTVPNKACCGNGRYGGDLSCLPLQPPCANRDQYIFWDSFHPTQAVNAIIANGCYRESGTDCYPISIYQLAQI
ncbi:hypothetical protein HHK36_015094 [Tetracentron sinense]|uniref:GDSL esterase/lipase 7 n=1 Tax=Tetracentron sinense TaxID=13715 RepID=A0A835DGE7_TETSI|nr:hypothetical protein HHK36_015094 [Tetracentron sinense]